MHSDSRTDRLRALLDPAQTHTSDAAGIPSFIASERREETDAYNSGNAENGWKNFFKRWPKVYDVLVFFIGPSFFCGVTPRMFIKKYVPQGVVLNAGSGVKRLSDTCINVDLFPFPGVDLVADLEHLPFRNGVFDGVTCDQVIEHAERPQAICKELIRITKQGGLIHVAAPFLFPWHPSPSDFSRWTLEGLASLFPDCEVVKHGIMAGPWSALTAFLAAFLATVLCFGSATLQGILQYVFLVLLFPLKFLDALFGGLPGAELCAANFFIIVRKTHA